MKLTYLLSQMRTRPLECRIAAGEISEDTCVLPAGGTAIPGHIYVARPEELADFLDREGRNVLCVFCAGALPEGLTVPAGCSIVSFRESSGELFMDVQHTLQRLRREKTPTAGPSGLLEQLIEGQLRGEENAGELLRGLGLQRSRRFCLVTVSPAGIREAASWRGLRKDLSSTLDTQSIFLYRNEMIALCTLEENETVPDLESRELNELLCQWDAYAAVSNSAVRPSAIRALYFQAGAAMRFGLSLKKEESKRLFRYEEYAAYLIVDLCAEGYRRSLHSDDLVYLCHPALGNVLRYDRENGTDLAKILRRYLDNNCNMSQTARELFIHRNTMLNRLDKLEELLGVHLKAPSVRLQLQFSFYIADYSERCLHRPVF